MERKRIDLHSHSFLSDGVLLPSELLRRAEATGHRALAITDHADASNIEYLVDSLRELLRAQPSDFGTQMLIGIELTHVGPASIDNLARRAKDHGAEIVVVHGETMVEPVAGGTNRAAIESAAVDLLAHPGFLTLEEAKLAQERGCYIEITARKGHSLTNGHVARICREAGAQMVLDTDAHAPADLATFEFAQRVAQGAGLTETEVLSATVTHPQQIVDKILALRAAGH